jgi:hypothetical protein
MKFEMQPQSTERVLSNGLRILHETIEETDSEITFSFTLDKEVPVSELQDLWKPTPNGDENAVITKRLKEKGWILPDNTTFVHFKMDIKTNDDGKTVIFKYYSVDDSPFNKGTETIQ